MTFDTPHRRLQHPTVTCRISAGFTLIELLIAVAVIGILAAIAIPNYTKYVKSSRVSDGKALLMDTAGQLERCYTVDSSYAGCIDSGALPLISKEEFYQITSANFTASAATYTIKATADADLVKCSELQVDHKGERSSDNGCW